MLWLSRLRLNPLQPAVAAVLASPTPLHRAVYAGFDRGERGDGRILFRVEPERWRGCVTLLVQSDLVPDWRELVVEQLGGSPAPDVKRFAATQLDIESAQTLRFRIRANPVWSQPHPGAKRGKRKGLPTEELQRAWLERQLQRHAGAELADCRLVDEGLWYDIDPRDPRRTKQRQFQSVLFDGHLRVTDPEALILAVERGIGPAKAFGFGLLSLAPA